MGDDPFAKTVLALCLVCAALLVARGLPGRGSEAAAPDAGSDIEGYDITLVQARRTIAPHPFFLHDARDGRLWLMRDFLSATPVLIPFEMVPSLEPFREAAKPRGRAKNVLDLIVETVHHAESPMLRAWAADQLGLGDHPQEVITPALIDALDDEKPSVVEAAARSLSRRPDRRALPALLALRDHEDPGVAAMVQQAIDAIEAAP